MKKQTLLTAVVSALAASAIAGGVAWAAIGAGGVIQGCYDSGGNLKVVSALPCPKGYTALAWNQQGPKGEKGDPGPAGKDGLNGTNGTNGADGQDGQDGVSVTSESEPTGPNCAEGGSKFTVANGATYACNGAQGTDGQDGADGEDGAPCLPTNPACVGPTGPTGPSGPLAGYQIVSSSISVPGGALGIGDALCPTGKLVLGGGVDTGPQSGLLRNSPYFDGEGWVVTYLNGTAYPVTVTIYAVCASAA